MNIAGTNRVQLNTQGTSTAASGNALDGANRSLYSEKESKEHNTNGRQQKTLCSSNSKDASTTTMKQMRNSGTNPVKVRTKNSGNNPERKRVASSSTSTKNLIKTYATGSQSTIPITKNTGTTPRKASTQNNGTNPTKRATHDAGSDPIVRLTASKGTNSTKRATHDAGSDPIVRLTVSKGTNPTEMATQNVGSNPEDRNTCSTGTQKDFPNKDTNDVGTSPDKKSIVSTGVSTIRSIPTVSTGVNTKRKKLMTSTAATQKDLETKSSRSMGTDPVVNICISSSTQYESKKTKDAGTDAEMKSVASVETSVESGSEGAMNHHGLSKIDAKAAQKVSDDMQKAKIGRNKDEEACRLKLKKYEHSIRTALINKIGKSKWKLLSFKERLEIMEKEVGEKADVASNEMKSLGVENNISFMHNGSVPSQLPSKPSTVSSSTSMEDLVQIRLDADVEEQRRLRREEEERFERYRMDMDEKIRLMTDKFASQIAEAARVSDDDDDDIFYEENHFERNEFFNFVGSQSGGFQHDK